MTALIQLLATTPLAQVDRCQSPARRVLTNPIRRGPFVTLVRTANTTGAFLARAITATVVTPITRNAVDVRLVVPVCMPVVQDVCARTAPRARTIPTLVGARATATLLADTHLLKARRSRCGALPVPTLAMDGAAVVPALPVPTPLVTVLHATAALLVATKASRGSGGATTALPVSTSATLDRNRASPALLAT